MADQVYDGRVGQIPELPRLPPLQIAEDLLNGDLDSFFPVPQEFLCLVSQEMYTDPVMAADGFVYERDAIESWFKSNYNSNRPYSSPYTNQSCGTSRVWVDKKVRTIMQEFFQQRRVQAQRHQELLQQREAELREEERQAAELRLAGLREDERRAARESLDEEIQTKLRESEECDAAWFDKYNKLVREHEDLKQKPHLDMIKRMLERAELQEKMQSLANMANRLQEVRHELQRNIQENLHLPVHVSESFLVSLDKLKVMEYEVDKVCMAVGVKLDGPRCVPDLMHLDIATFIKGLQSQEDEEEEAAAAALDRLLIQAPQKSVVVVEQGGFRALLAVLREGTENTCKHALGALASITSDQGGELQKAGLWLELINELVYEEKVVVLLNMLEHDCVEAQQPALLVLTEVIKHGLPAEIVTAKGGVHRLMALLGSSLNKEALGALVQVTKDPKACSQIMSSDVSALQDCFFEVDSLEVKGLALAVIVNVLNRSSQEQHLRFLRGIQEAGGVSHFSYLLKSDELEVAVKATEGLAFLLKGAPRQEDLEELLEGGCVPVLVGLVRGPCEEVQRPAVHALCELLFLRSEDRLVLDAVSLCTEGLVRVVSRCVEQIQEHFSELPTGSYQDRVASEKKGLTLVNAVALINAAIKDKGAENTRQQMPVEDLSTCIRVALQIMELSESPGAAYWPLLALELREGVRLAAIVLLRACIVWPDLECLPAEVYAECFRVLALYIRPEWVESGHEHNVNVPHGHRPRNVKLLNVPILICSLECMNVLLKNPQGVIEFDKQDLLPKIQQMLHIRPVSTVTELCASALAELLDKDPRKVRDFTVLDDLADMLQGRSQENMGDVHSAMMAVANWAKGNPKLRKQIARIGLMPLLCQLMGHPFVGIRALASETMEELCKDHQVAMLFGTQDGIQLLAGYAQRSVNGHPSPQMNNLKLQAVRLLWYLAEHGALHSVVASAIDYEVLHRLSKPPNFTAIRDAAAGLLQELAKDPSHKSRLLKGGS